MSLAFSEQLEQRLQDLIYLHHELIDMIRHIQDDPIEIDESILPENDLIKPVTEPYYEECSLHSLQ